jgi:hypothetical protein
VALRCKVAGRWLALAAVLVFSAAACQTGRTPASQPTIEMRTAPALVPLPTNTAWVTLHGEAVDDQTGEVIPEASFVITTTAGVVSFTGTYSITVPGLSVVTYYVTAPGYSPATYTVRPHYARSVSVTAPIPLARAEAAP